MLGRGCEIRVRHLVFKGSNGVIYGVRSLLVFIFYSYKKKYIYGVGLWKYIQRGWDSFMHFTHFDVEFLEFTDSQ